MKRAGDNMHRHSDPNHQSNRNRPITPDEARGLRLDALAGGNPRLAAACDAALNGDFAARMYIQQAWHERATCNVCGGDGGYDYDGTWCPCGACS